MATGQQPAVGAYGRVRSIPMKDDVRQSIVSAAHDCLAKSGASSMSLEAVAGEAGVTLELVETFFQHRDDLLTELIVDAYNNSGAAMEQADLSAQRRGDDPGARLLAAARGLRAWSLDNKDDFSLIYGSPVPGYDAPPETVGPASRTPAVLADIVREALSRGCLRAPVRAFSGPPLVNEAAVALFRGSPEPPYSDLIERGIVLWGSLIGMLIFEVFSRTHDSVSDQERFFDFSVAVAAESVGLVVPAADQTSR